MKISSRKILQDAYGTCGIAAFNVFNAEQVHGIFKGASSCGRPVIIQLTPVARNYISPEMLEAMISSASQLYPDVDFSVHLDHGTYEHCIDAINSGFYDSVMIDASHESFTENIRITKSIVQAAHAKNVFVEAELGVLSGVEDDLAVDDEMARYTNPSEAYRFVQETQCDSLAVAVGTSHGAYKFSGGKGLQIEVLKKIQSLLPGFPLVLHGASAVNIEEVKRINAMGGELRSSASGLKNDVLLQAIEHGVCKINIATDLRLIWTRVHREFFMTSPEKIDLVEPGNIFMNEVALLVSQKCKLLKLN